MNTQSNNDLLSEYIISPIYTVSSNIGNSISNVPSIITNNDIYNNVSTTISNIGDSTEQVYKSTLNTIRNDNNILMSIIESFRGNWFRILLVASIISLLMFLITAKNLNNNKHTEKEKEKEKIQVQIREGLTNKEKNNLLKDMKNGFCNTHSGNSDNLDIQCNKLSKNICNMVDCCVFANINNNTKCVAGSKSGPTFKTDLNGNNLNIDYYYYKNKCFGNC
jgi:hypothetical protein